MASSVTERSKDVEIRRLLDFAFSHELGTVGIHADSGATPHDAKSGLSVAEIADKNEFGRAQERIPQRSFVRGWFDENQEALHARLKGKLALALLAKSTVAKAVEASMKEFAESMKQRIRNRIPPRNARRTLAKKIGDTPLIDTRVMINSIQGRHRG